MKFFLLYDANEVVKGIAEKVSGLVGNILIPLLIIVLICFALYGTFLAIKYNKIIKAMREDLSLDYKRQKLLKKIKNLIVGILIMFGLLILFVLLKQYAVSDAILF